MKERVRASSPFSQEFNYFERKKKFNLFIAIRPHDDTFLNDSNIWWPGGDALMQFYSTFFFLKKKHNVKVKCLLI